VGASIVVLDADGIVGVAVAVLSAFISNTAATAFFVPMVIGMVQGARISPSKLLMPLAFASILISAVTLISTSTNIVVSGLMTRYGLDPRSFAMMIVMAARCSFITLLELCRACWCMGRGNTSSSTL
jgi:di/tricarboxylate transporter